MFELTKQERAVLIALSFILFFGSVLNYTFKKNPHLRDIVNFVDSEDVYKVADINSASIEELTSVPYIGETLAKRIVEYRQHHGGFKNLEEVRYVKGVGPSVFKRIKKYLSLKKL